MIKVNQTYKIDKNAPINFNTAFRAEVKKVYTEIFYMLKGTKGFDQISLKITDNKGAVTYYGNNYINTDCLDKVMNLAKVGDEAECK